ncbi:MAG TPA: hypothetical protein VL860_14330 [Planctomycetota bacterium]|nr:hypothetical protein [Planctomycetota bacterium]
MFSFSKTFRTAVATGLLITATAHLTAADQPAQTKDGDKPTPPPATDAKSPAPAPAPAIPGRWVITLDDDGTVTGVIVAKSAQKWIVRTDTNRLVEIARDRIRLVKPQEPEATADKPHPEGGGGGGGGDHPPAPANGGGDHPPAPPTGDHPGGPRGDGPRGDGAPKNPHPRVSVVMNDGKTITGVVESGKDGEATIKTDKGELIHITKDQVKSFNLLDK